MKPKILYIITQGHWGGAQKHVAELAQSMMREWDVTVACGEKPDELFTALAHEAVRTIPLRHLVRRISPLKDLRAVFEIKKILACGNFDIVHAHSSKAGFIVACAHALARLSSRGYHTRMVYTAHGWIFMEDLFPPVKWLYRAMEQMSARLRDVTIVLSQKEKTIALAYHTALPHAIYIIPNGVSEIQFFDRAHARQIILKKNSRVLPDNRMWIGAVANLYRSKGIDMLIEAAHILSQSHASSLPYFFVIGEGPERASLHALINRFSLQESFFLIGTIPDAASALKAFDIFVLPSRKEGFPYTALEASSAGLPIIASKAGALPEIIQDGHNGILIEDDARAFAHAIQELIADTQKRAFLSQHARHISTRFALDRAIADTKAAYQSLLSFKK